MAGSLPPRRGPLRAPLPRPEGGARASASPRVQRFSVTFEYPVYFTRALFDPENPVFREALVGAPDAGLRAQRFAVVIDAGVEAAWPRLRQEILRYAERHREGLDLAAPPRTVPGGEPVKNDPAVVNGLHAWVRELHLDRQSALVVIGGGAVQDAAGYAAATAHRGLRTVRVPTTVLAQNDSGVGVKNGVNAFGVKNFVGTFAPPFAVVNDFDFLATLEPRDRVAGMAEAVKVALIRDPDFFVWLEAHAAALAAFEPGALETLVRRSAELHLEHIATSGDPFEFGSARPLDFGHWAAHKLEALSGYRLRHGEAVAIGIALDARYSVEAGLLPEAELERGAALLERLGLPLWDDALEARDAAGRHLVLQGLDEFREHLGGELTVTLLRGLGRAGDVNEMEEARILAALGWLQRRARPG